MGGVGGGGGPGGEVACMERGRLCRGTGGREGGGGKQVGDLYGMLREKEEGGGGH